MNCLAPFQQKSFIFLTFMRTIPLEMQWFFLSTLPTNCKSYWEERQATNHSQSCLFYQYLYDRHSASITATLMTSSCEIAKLEFTSHHIYSCPCTILGHYCLPSLLSLKHQANLLRCLRSNYCLENISENRPKAKSNKVEPKTTSLMSCFTEILLLLLVVVLVFVPRFLGHIREKLQGRQKIKSTIAELQSKDSWCILSQNS